MDTNKALWIVRDRQVRPGSFVLSVLTGFIGVAGLFGVTRLSGTGELFSSAVALLTAGAMWVGWWGQSLRAMLAGLLGAVWTWTVIALIAFYQGASVVTVTIAIGWAMLAAMLYLRDKRERP